MAASHTQPAMESSDGRMLGGQLLATRGTRSYADRTASTSGVISLFKGLNSAGDKTIRSGETCERVVPLLGTAAASPGRSQAKQSAAMRRRLPTGLLIPEWVGRSVSGNVEYTRSPTNLEFHVPTSGQCSAPSCCCSEKSSLVASKEHAQVTNTAAESQRTTEN